MWYQESIYPLRFNIGSIVEVADNLSIDMYHGIEWKFPPDVFPCEESFSSS